MRFQYPFPGKHKPLKLVSIFLVDPEFFLKLHNAPLSWIYKQIDEESLFKRLQNISKVLNPNRLIREMGNKFFKNKNSVLWNVLMDENSDEKYDLVNSQNKLYKFMFAGLYDETDLKLTYRALFLLDVENQISSADLLFRRGKYQEAVSDLLKQSISAHILWDEAKEIISSGANYNDLLSLRLCWAMEMLLAVLAATDVNFKVQHKLPNFLAHDVLPIGTNCNKNPTSLLYQVLKQEMNAKSMEHLVDLSKGYRLTVDNLKLWSSGKHLPDFFNFLGMLDANFKGVTHQKLQLKYMAVRMINFIGYHYTEFQKLSDLKYSEIEKKSFRPLPSYPFGHTTMEEWLSDRYFYWINFHSNEIERKGCFPSDSEGLLTF